MPSAETAATGSQKARNTANRFHVLRGGSM
jgi:hypothetical protein